MAWNGNDRKPHPASTTRPGRSALAGVGLAMLALVVVGALLWTVVNDRSQGDPKPSSRSADANTGTKIAKANPRRFCQTPDAAVRNAMPKNLNATKPKRKRATGNARLEMYDHLDGHERKLAMSVQAALDENDFDATVLAAKAALKSENAEVRQTAVEALGWFGASALPELTGCLADPDDDVRETAQNQWELALQDVEKPSDRFEIAAAAFATLSGEDALTSIGGLLSNAATEMIDSEEDESKSAENRLRVLQTLVDIIASGKTENVEAAKEAYADITCNKWISVQEAERYLDAPDSYDPDERPDVIVDDGPDSPAD